MWLIALILLVLVALVYLLVEPYFYRRGSIQSIEFGQFSGGIAIYTLQILRDDNRIVYAAVIGNEANLKINDRVEFRLTGRILSSEQVISSETDTEGRVHQDYWWRYYYMLRDFRLIEGN